MVDIKHIFFLYLTDKILNNPHIEDKSPGSTLNMCHYLKSTQMWMRIDEDGGGGIKYLRRAQKVTKVWKGRSDGDGSVLGGSRAALIHNDGAALAVRIAIPEYPQVPASTF